jgi:DNA-directed RNA polymerase subunit RPC12/RpoP
MQNSPELTPKPPIESADSKTGRTIDSGKGRIFPCDRCGADLEFSIGQQSLQCPYCGSVKEIEPPADKPILERDFHEMLQRLKQLRESKKSHDDESATNQHEIHCDSCGAEVIFQGTLTSTFCPYCAVPLQRDKIHDSVSRIPVDGMLPFLIQQTQAAQNLRQWVKTMWFAPNEFLRQGANGKFNGVYLPFFTYDALTYTRYTGQRGDAYFVTVGEGNNQRQERRVRWTYAGGDFQRFFDDVLIIAATKHN